MRERSRSPAGGGEDLEIRRLIFEREQARLAKDFASADSLRDRLGELGVTLFDKTNTWKSADGRTGRIPTFSEIEAGTTAEAIGDPQPELDDSEEGHIKKMVQQREQARAAKDFAASDRIRDELKAMGVELFDKEKMWRSKTGASGCIIGYRSSGGPTDIEITTLVAQREKARQSSDFSTADMIRDELKKGGVEIDDKHKVWRANDGRSSAVPSWAAMAGPEVPVQVAAPAARGRVSVGPGYAPPPPPLGVRTGVSEAVLREEILRAASAAARNPATAAGSLQQLANLVRGGAPPPPPQAFPVAHAPPMRATVASARVQPSRMAAPVAEARSPEFLDAVSFLKDCQAGGRGANTNEISWVVEVREKCRQNKDFASSDELRDLLRSTVGVELHEKEKRWEASDGRQGDIPLWSSMAPPGRSI